MKVLGLLFLLLLSVCNGRVLWAVLNGQNKVLQISTANPGGAINTLTVTGLGSTVETILSLDFRPQNGRLYLLTSANKLYYLNTITGAATSVSTLGGCTTTTTATYTMDFNPVADRLRVVSSAGSNWVVDVDTGACTASPDINGGRVVGIAYTSNFRGATDTSIYAIDSSRSVVGTLDINTAAFTVIGTGLFETQKIKPTTGLDYVDNVLYGSLQIDAFSYLYSVNVTTGLAANLGLIGDGTPIRAIAAALSGVERSFFGLSTDNSLVRFESENPTSVVTSQLSGLNGETLLGLDFRPQDNLLYAVSATSVYQINVFTYAATKVGATLNCTLTGTYFGVDWNPTADLIRVISDSGKNYRVNTNTSLCFEDADINPSTVKTSAIAYNNNFVGAHSSTLYALDYEGDTLGNINLQSGAYTSLGAISQPTGPTAGFDILSEPYSYIITGVACIEQGDVSYFMIVNLATGAMSFVGQTDTVKIRSLSGAIRRPAYSYNGVYPSVYLLTTGTPQSILALNSTDTSIYTSVQVKNLGSGVRLLGMDIRPKTGDFVAVGSDSVVYYVNPKTGEAFYIAKMSCTMLATTIYALGFDNAADAIRITSSGSDNFQVDPSTGVCKGLTPFTGAFGQLVLTGIAFTNSYKDATSSQGYLLESSYHNLLRMIPPDSYGSNTAFVGASNLLNRELTPMDIFTNDQQQMAFVAWNGLLIDMNLGSGNIREWGAIPGATDGSIVGVVAVLPTYTPPEGIPTAAPTSGSGVSSTTTTTTGSNSGNSNGNSSSGSSVTIGLALLVCTTLMTTILF